MEIDGTVRFSGTTTDSEELQSLHPDTVAFLIHDGHLIECESPTIRVPAPSPFPPKQTIAPKRSKKDLPDE